MTDNTRITHVADAIVRLSGEANECYDATADFAANLLDEYSTVESAVKSYEVDKITAEEFDAVVNTAVQLAGE